MEIIPKEASRFLDLIVDASSNWHFQTFDDKKESGTATTPEGPFNVLMIDTLAVSNKHGAGVFVAVNTHIHKKRRSKKTTERINAIFCDFDNDETARDQMEQLTDNYPASIVVESSPGKFHVYYVLSTPGSIPVADFSRWQKQLSKQWGSDPKVIDPSRVMRLPGFCHQKGEPFITRIVDERTTGRKFSLDQLVSMIYGGRNNWLTSIAGQYRHNGAGYDEVLDILTGYNQSLEVSLDEDEVVAIAGNIQVYDPDPNRALQHQADMLALELNLDMNKAGAIMPTLQNALRVVEYERRFRFNTLASQIEVVHPVEWNRTNGYQAWVDMDTVNYLSYLVNKYNTEWPRTHIETAIDHVASKHMYDPLTEYLNQIKWDGKPRVATALHRHLAADDNEYTRAVSESMFVGAVRRAFDPGCKYDHMVVLVGDEGSGKSRFCATIAKFNEFFTDSLGDLRNKDSVINMQGKWIVEFGELKSMQGVSAEHTKAFISAQVDNIRLPFGKRTQPFPRRCIFIGSTNNPTFITDTGTNRRMLPVFTPLSEESGNVMDAKALEEEVDQLWAEAVHMYKNGHNAQVPHSVMKMAMEHRLSSTEDGGYGYDIIQYINDEKGEVVNGEPQKRSVFLARDFYLAVVENASREKWVGESRLHKQIANAARKILSSGEHGVWKFGNRRINGVPTKCWSREE